MTKKALLILFAVVLAFSLLFVGCKAEEEAAEAASEKEAEETKEPEEEGPKSGGVLVFGRGGDSVGLDPARETDGESFYATTQIFDNLVEFKNGTTEIQPALAKSWDISDDNLTFTFHLVENATFHDGTPLQCGSGSIFVGAANVGRSSLL